MTPALAKVERSIEISAAILARTEASSNIREASRPPRRAPLPGKRLQSRPINCLIIKRVSEIDKLLSLSAV